MKRTKMDTSFKLNGISVALAMVMSMVFCSGSFAADTAKTDKDAKTEDVKKEDLSQYRMRIQKEKLEQEFEREKLGKLKIKAEQAKIEDQINGVSTTGAATDANMPNAMTPSEEEKIATAKGIPQNVGFIYKNDAETVQTQSKKPNNILDALTGKGDKDKSNTEGSDDVSAVLKKFDLLKKESDTTVKSMSEYVVTKTLLETKLDMLSIFDENKTAKLRFVYLHDDGIQKKKVITVVTVNEGKVFNVEDDTYKIDKIDSDGLVIVNIKTKEETIITKNN